MTEQAKSTRDDVRSASGSGTGSGDVGAIRRDTIPTIFADGLLGGSVESGVVRLELLARHLDPEPRSVSPALVGRLLMPADKLAAFAAALQEVARNAK